MIPTITIEQANRQAQKREVLKMAKNASKTDVLDAKSKIQELESKIMDELRFCYHAGYREMLKSILRDQGVNPDGICIYETEGR